MSRVRTDDSDRPVVVLDSSSLPRGELLGGADDGRTPGAPRERTARRLAVAALLVGAVGLLQVPELRSEAAAARALDDQLAVTATVSEAGVERMVAFSSMSGGPSSSVATSTVVVGVTVRNSGPLPVQLRSPALEPALAGVGPAFASGPGDADVPAGGSAVVELRFQADCAALDGFATPRTLGATVVARSGRRQRVEVPVTVELSRLGPDACRRTPLVESLVLTASNVVLDDDRLTFDLGFARDTLQSGSLVAVGSRGLRVRTEGLPRLLPLAGRDEPEVVGVTVEIGDCAMLRLNPRGFLLLLDVVVADGGGRRSSFSTGIGDDSDPLNRLAAGLLARGCGFDPLFRTA